MMAKMMTEVSLAIGLIVPALLLPQVLTFLNGSGDPLHQPTYRTEPVLYQSRACDPVNDPSSCQPS